MGNRLSSLGVPSYSYNSSNELTSASPATFTYDANGNTTSKTDSSGTTTYTWDFENRLTSVTLPNGHSQHYKYDPFGRRIFKDSPTKTRVFVYDGDNVSERLDGSGKVTVRFTQGLGIDEPLAMYQNGVADYYEADGLGSITSLTGSSGSVVNAYEYDSFGQLTGSNETVSNTFRYTGREDDGETKLYYYRARYYDPATGHFLNEDPIGFNGGPNFFSYAGNNPANLNDPLGWFPRGRDKWYGYNDRDFQMWFHRCWKAPGDPDASRDEIEEAFAEWARRGKPRGGDCYPKPNKCPQEQPREVPAPQGSPIPPKGTGTPFIDWVEEHPGTTLLVIGGTVTAIVISVATGGGAAGVITAGAVAF